MTDQRELDRLLGAYFVEGTNELADRVLDAALDEIEHVRQRRPARLPRSLSSGPVLARLAIAAAIGALAVGSLIVIQAQPEIGAGPSQPAGPSRLIGEPTPSPTPRATPTRLPPATPDIPALTGALGAGRQIHTATLLADGRVLITGGFDNKDEALSSAVIYDPATDTFSQTGSMASARGQHTATLLLDGRVLITGGGPASWVHTGDYLASAELYDPATGTFSPTGPMTSAREEHTATRLQDGRVLIAGGSDLGSHTIATAEVYDPATGTFSPTGPMTTGRAFHTASLLADGRVLVAGGDPNSWLVDGAMLATTEVYDPATGTFSETGAMHGGRAYHTATTLLDGRVLVTGGTDTTTDFATAELFDPRTGTFAETGPMSSGRVYHTATVLKDGRVLVAGGGGDYTNRSFLQTAEAFDPALGSFASTGSLTDARTYHAATLLPDGRVLVTGGYGSEAPLASAELYDPATGTFTQAGAGR